MGGEKNVLIIDDDVVQRRVIGMIAKKLGLDITEADSFASAERALQAKRYDAISLDLGLGEENGILLLRSIARFNAAARVIIISGAEQAALNTAENVANDVNINASLMRKPLNLTELKRFFENSDRRSPREQTGVSTAACRFSFCS